MGKNNKNNNEKGQINSENSRGKRGKEVKKKKGKIRKFFGRLFLILLIALIIAGGVFAYKVKQNGGGLGGLLTTTLGTDKEKIKNLPTIYCVLFGQSQNLTDTIMLVSYTPRTQKVGLLSIPRDTFIGKNKNTATPYDKINALCQSSPEKAVKAVSDITGIPVTNYILVDTKSLVKLVDLIGGVWFDVPIDMKYSDSKQDLYIRLKAGYQLLDGDKAEQLVRFRHNSDRTTYPKEYGEEDLGRTRTQREFLTAVAKQTLKPQNLLKIKGLLDIVYENIKTNMTLTDFKDYIPAMVNFETENLATGILPGKSELCNGYYVYPHDKKETEKLVKELFFEDENSEEGSNNTISNTIGNNTGSTVNEEKLVGEGITVEILNGTTNTNVEQNLKNKLVENGYTVKKVSKTSATEKTTIINNKNKDEEAIEDVKMVVGTGEVSNEVKAGSTVDIVIVIGKDY